MLFRSSREKLKGVGTVFLHARLAVSNLCDPTRISVAKLTLVPILVRINCALKKQKYCLIVYVKHAVNRFKLEKVTVAQANTAPRHVVQRRLCQKAPLTQNGMVALANANITVGK